MTKQDYYRSKSWRQIRELKLKQDPYCELCMLNGMQTKAHTVHHIIKFFDQPTDYIKEQLLCDTDNLCAVCDKCHQHIHQQRDKYLWPFQRVYLDTKKNDLCQKYWNKGIIIKWTNDDNRKGHR